MTKEQILKGLESKELQDLRVELEEKKGELAEKEEELEKLDDWEMEEEEYDELLDDVYGDVEIAGISYSTSKILNEVDEIRYSLGKDEEEDRKREEKREELEGEIEELKPDIEDLKTQIEELGGVE